MILLIFFQNTIAKDSVYHADSRIFLPTFYKKGRDLTQSYDKSPYTHRKIQKQRDNIKNTKKTFDYTTIADRLSTVSWSNSTQPTGVVKHVYERLTFPLTATAV